ncbi:MAG: hypothetical protein ACLQIB_14305 [Isosphaeraceae bacterium]
MSEREHEPVVTVTTEGRFREKRASSLRRWTNRGVTLLAIPTPPAVRLKEQLRSAICPLLWAAAPSP